MSCSDRTPPSRLLAGKINSCLLILVMIDNDWRILCQKLPNIWQKHQWIYHWINKSEANYYKHNRTVLVFLLCSCNCVWHVSSLIVCCVIPMFEESDVYPNVWRGRCLPIISWMLFLCPVFRSPISTEIWDVFYSLNKETMWQKVTLIVWLLMDERHHISSSVFPLTVHFLKGEELEKKSWISE